MLNNYFISNWCIAIGIFTLQQLLFSDNKDHKPASDKTTVSDSLHSPLTNPPEKLYCGYSHTLAIKYDSTLWVWGSNSMDQLGNNNSGEIWYPLQVSGMTGIIKAAGGYEHSLALKSDGTVWSWGKNTDGELGDGTTTKRSAPVQTTALSNIVSIGSGYYHSLAVKSDGSVWTWGKNNLGQLGNGTTTNSSTPGQLTTLSNIVDAGGGEEFSIALKSDGTIWSWGYNQQRQLGDGTTTQRKTPVQVTGGIIAVAISAGRDHSLALKADGTVWAWGYNGYGQIGNGNTTNQGVPVQVTGLTNIIAIAAGENHSLALKSDGTIWAWGRNNQGQLGKGDIDEGTHSKPVQSGNFSPATAISAATQSVAAKADGSFWGWGTNTKGQSGKGSNFLTFSPERSLFTYIQRVDLPTFSPDGGAYTSARNVTVSCSTAGVTIHYTTDGTDPTESDPVIISGHKVTITQNKILKATAFKSGLGPALKAAVYLIGERAIAGFAHSVAILGSTNLYVWGSNTRGQLGDTTLPECCYKYITKEDTPACCYKHLPQFSPFNQSDASGSDADAGAEHTICLSGDSVVAWGRNTEGQIGDGGYVQKDTPTGVIRLNVDVINVAAGSYHSLAIKNDRSLWTWGRNNRGQLGNGTTTNSPLANPVGISDVIDVAGGFDFTIALKADGTVWAWGGNDFGQLGDGRGGASRKETTPVRVSGGFNVIAIAAGNSHALALKSDGTVWAWGLNGAGQVGTGIATSAEVVPVRVNGLSNVIAIAAGELHSLALKADGSLWAWGDNEFGQLGDLSYDDKLVPVPVYGLDGGVTSFDCSYHTLVRTSIGGLYWSFGRNQYGQLGNDDSTNKANQNARHLVHFGGWEGYLYLDAAFVDLDNDGLSIWEEALHGTNIYIFDVNGDYLSDGVNIFLGINPWDTDTDRDGISNTQEILNGTSPIRSDTDGDGFSDLLDEFPLDRFLSKKPPPNATDHTAPDIILKEPPF